MESAVRNKMLGMAKVAGLQVINLSPAFESVVDRSSLILVRWDDHTTVLGHRPLAEEFGQRSGPSAVWSAGQSTDLAFAKAVIVGKAND